MSFHALFLPSARRAMERLSSSPLGRGMAIAAVWWRHAWGLPMVAAGVAIEVAYVALGLSGHNALLLAAVALVVVGAAGYVAGLRRQ